MEQFQMEMAGKSRETKLQVLRGLMQCVGSDGKATRDFELRMALGAVVTVPQSQVIKAVLWLKAKVS
jgi:hypothetical protein